MQLAREPVALLDDVQLAAALVQAGVLDRQPGVRGERLDERLVCVGELVARLLVGEVERADDLAPRDDRHAEERAHRGVRRRPPAAEARVAADVGRPVRAVGLQHRSEQPVLARQLAERRDELVAHSRGDEPREAAVAVGHTDRGVARARQLARGVDELLEHRLDRVLGGDRQDGIRQRGGGPDGGHGLMVGRHGSLAS